jgi:hypothetical protein
MMATVTLGPFSVDTKQDAAIIAYYNDARNKSQAFRIAMSDAIDNTATLEKVSIALEEIQAQLDRVEARLKDGVSVVYHEATKRQNEYTDLEDKLGGLFGGEQ